MSDDFPTQLARYAQVIVRVGLNLQRGQRLLIAEPFELQGVAASAAPLVEAVRVAATEAGASGVEVFWADEARVRAAVLHGRDRAFDSGLVAQMTEMETHVKRGDALLLLQASHPQLMDGVPHEAVARFRERCWELYGRVAPRLVAGETNWTCAPAPVPAWAAAVFPQAEHAPTRDARLWQTVFEACRVHEPDPVAAWATHLAVLRTRRDELNTRHARAVCMRGPGTDFEVELAREHVWCTACLRTRAGLSFVANLPTEEIFTAPHRLSARGRVRVARPIAYGGATIDGIELEFRDGAVVRASARHGEELLHRILATDRGAVRLGEVAIIASAGVRGEWARSGILYGHTLLDENVLDHIALGDGYPFTVRDPRDDSLNHSLIHIDLPLELGEPPELR